MYILFLLFCLIRLKCKTQTTSRRETTKPRSNLGCLVTGVQNIIKKNLKNTAKIQAAKWNPHIRESTQQKNIFKDTILQ